MPALSELAQKKPCDQRRPITITPRRRSGSQINDDPDGADPRVLKRSHSAQRRQIIPFAIKSQRDFMKGGFAAIKASKKLCWAKHHVNWSIAFSDATETKCSIVVRARKGA